MTGIQAGGAGSGLDIASLVTQLVAAERAPLDARITRLETKATLQLSSLAQVKSAMATLRDALGSLKDLAAFAVRTATSSAPATFTATADGQVRPGGFDVEVLALASAHKLASEPFAAGRDAVVGSGTLSITVGAKTFAVEFAAPATLAQVRDAINAAADNAGVSASIVNETGGSRLVLTARETGASHAIAVRPGGGDGGLAAFARDPAAPGAATLGEVAPARDARVSIDGFEIGSPGNVVAGAVDGVTLNLLKAEPGTTHTLTVANDVTTASSRVGKLVSSYNALVKLLRSMQSYDAASGKAGPMLGDAYVRGLEQSLRRDVAEPVAGAGALNALATLGIRTDASGQLVVDTQKLDRALAAGFDGVAAVFAGADGVAGRLHTRLEAALRSDAQLAGRTETLNRQVKSLAVEKTRVDARMESVEARYRRQFTALDTLLTQMQSTGNFLTQQLSALNKG